MTDKWIKCSELLPPCGILVDTKIDDINGCRNEVELKRYQRTPEARSLWFIEDGSMYVYYEPTHWKFIDLVKVYENRKST